MKYIKFFFLNIVVFGTLLFLISLLFPKQVVTAKTVSINSDKQKVKSKILNKEEWKNWNHFLIQTNETKFVNTNADTLSFLVENENRQSLKTQFYLFSQQNNITILNWALIQKLPWYKPWKKFSAMVINKQLAAVMDSSLNNFKTQLESEK